MSLVRSRSAQWWRGRPDSAIRQYSDLRNSKTELFAINLLDICVGLKSKRRFGGTARIQPPESENSYSFCQLFAKHPTAFGSELNASGVYERHVFIVVFTKFSILRGIPKKIFFRYPRNFSHNKSRKKLYSWNVLYCGVHENRPYGIATARLHKQYRTNGNHAVIVFFSRHFPRRIQLQECSEQQTSCDFTSRENKSRMRTALCTDILYYFVRHTRQHHD